MKNYLYLVLVLSLASCMNPFGGSKVVKGNEIPDNISNEINDLDMKVFSALKLGSTPQLNEFMSAALKKSTENDNSAEHTQFMSTMASSLEGKSYIIYKDYYCKGVLPGNLVHIKDGVGDKGYSIQFKSAAASSYVSLLRIQGGASDFLLTLIYGKYESGWKLNVIRADNFSSGKGDAVDLFRAAQKMYQAGDWIDATNAMFISEQFKHPVGTFWVYDLDKEMDAFSTKLKDVREQRMPLPYEVKGVAGAPQLYSLRTLIGNEKSLMITCKTETHVTDTVKLLAQTEELHKVLVKLSPGLDENNDHVIYLMYNEKPTQNYAPAHYTVEFGKGQLEGAIYRLPAMAH